MDQRKMVLLADASEEFRTLLREEIEKTGEFSVEVARDGNEVLKKTEERDPDLLVRTRCWREWTASAYFANCKKERICP